LSLDFDMKDTYRVINIQKVWDKKHKLIWTELTLEPIRDRDKLIKEGVIKY